MLKGKYSDFFKRNPTYDRFINCSCNEYCKHIVIQAIHDGSIVTTKDGSDFVVADSALKAGVYLNYIRVHGQKNGIRPSDIVSIQT
jgi:hypothetical protein